MRARARLREQSNNKLSDDEGLEKVVSAGCRRWHRQDVLGEDSVDGLKEAANLGGGEADPFDGEASPTDDEADGRWMRRRG